jgi:hypothetical protein
MDGYLREKKKFPESELTLDEFAWIREAGRLKKSATSVPRRSGDRAALDAESESDEKV